jgi:hypothetical protein
MNDVLLVSIGALLGAFATGAVRVGLEIWDRRTRRRIAARSVLGDIAVAEAAFKLLIERREWFRHDFGPALATWEKVRGDFAGSVSVADWAEVDSFYSNLFRTAAMARPHESARENDINAAEALIEYAEKAWKVAIGHVGGSKAERDEVVARLR